MRDDKRLGGSLVQVLQALAFRCRVHGEARCQQSFAHCTDVMAQERHVDLVAECLVENQRRSVSLESEKQPARLGEYPGELGEQPGQAVGRCVDDRVPRADSGERRVLTGKRRHIRDLIVGVGIAPPGNRDHGR